MDGTGVSLSQIAQWRGDRRIRVRVLLIMDGTGFSLSHHTISRTQKGDRRVFLIMDGQVTRKEKKFQDLCVK